MRLIFFFGFSGQVYEVMVFYVKVFGGQVILEMKYCDMLFFDGLLGCNEMLLEIFDYVVYSQFEIGNVILMVVDGFGGGEGGLIIINVDVDSIEEVECVFVVLVEGGQVQMLIVEMFWVYCWGMLIDCYGKLWMVNCMKQF